MSIGMKIDACWTAGSSDYSTFYELEIMMTPRTRKIMPNQCRACSYSLKTKWKTIAERNAVPLVIEKVREGLIWAEKDVYITK